MVGFIGMKDKLFSLNIPVLMLVGSCLNFLKASSLKQRGGKDLTQEVITPFEMQRNS